MFTSGSVFGAQVYGEIESCFAIIKLFAVALLSEPSLPKSLLSSVAYGYLLCEVVIAFIFNVDGAVQ